MEVTNEKGDGAEEKGDNLAWVAYRQRDAKLLELLLELDSSVLKKQLRTVTDKECLTLRLINLMDFDIWVALALNTTVFDPH